MKSKISWGHFTAAVVVAFFGSINFLRPPAAGSSLAPSNPAQTVGFYGFSVLLFIVALLLLLRSFRPKKGGGGQQPS